MTVTHAEFTTCSDRAYRGLRTRWADEDLKAMMRTPIYGLLLSLKSKVQPGLEICESGVDALIAGFGPEHPDTLEAQYYLVQIYTIQYRLNEAEPIARSLSETTAACIGRQKPYALRADILFVEISMALGKFASAEADIRDIVERANGVFGISHPKTLRCQSGLARCMFYAGKYHKALEYIETAFLSLMRTCFPYSIGRLSKETRELARLLTN